MVKLTFFVLVSPLRPKMGLLPRIANAACRSVVVPSHTQPKFPQPSLEAGALYYSTTLPFPTFGIVLIHPVPLGMGMRAADVSGDGTLDSPRAASPWFICVNYGHTGSTVYASGLRTLVAVRIYIYTTKIDYTHLLKKP